MKDLLNHLSYKTLDEDDIILLHNIYLFPKLYTDIKEKSICKSNTFIIEEYFQNRLKHEYVLSAEISILLFKLGFNMASINTHKLIINLTNYLEGVPFDIDEIYLCLNDEVKNIHPYLSTIAKKVFNNHSIESFSANEILARITNYIFKHSNQFFSNKDEETIKLG